MLNIPLLYSGFHSTKITAFDGADYIINFLIIIKHILAMLVRMDGFLCYQFIQIWDKFVFLIMHMCVLTMRLRNYLFGFWFYSGIGAYGHVDEIINDLGYTFYLP